LCESLLRDPAALEVYMPIEMKLEREMKRRLEEEEKLRQ
jgi:hypothetical protein